MVSKQRPNNIKYLGLLECPLRRGFITFEYQPGDLVSELIAKVEELWGPPVPISEGEGWLGLFHVISGWVILCQDEGGTFVSLSNKDQIPLQPPPVGNIKMRYPATKGKAINMDWDARAKLDKELNRIIIPEAYTSSYTSNYSIRLIALVAVGGA